MKEEKKKDERKKKKRKAVVYKKKNSCRVLGMNIKKGGDCRDCSWVDKVQTWQCAGTLPCNPPCNSQLKTCVTISSQCEVQYPILFLHRLNFFEKRCRPKWGRCHVTEKEKWKIEIKQMCLPPVNIFPPLCPFHSNRIINTIDAKKSYFLRVPTNSRVTFLACSHQVRLPYSV